MTGTNLPRPHIPTAEEHEAKAALMRQLLHEASNRLSSARSDFEGAQIDLETLAEQWALGSVPEEAVDAAQLRVEEERRRFERHELAVSALRGRTVLWR